MNIPTEIKNYYKICAIDRDREGVSPLPNQVERKALQILISETQHKIYFRERNGIYTIKENIIGAGRQRINGKRGIVI